jgi:hypothetical protein
MQEIKMAEYEVGYGKPPRHTQFKKGNRANPNGRGKRKAQTEADILKNVMSSVTEFRENGKSKQAPRIELMIRSIGEKARKGDVGAAEMLLKVRAYWTKYGDINPETVVFILTDSDAEA